MRVLGALLAGCAPVAPREGGVTTSTQDFTVEAFRGTSRGRPVVEGYVYNKRPTWATRVLLRVDALDAAELIFSTISRYRGC